MSLSSPDTSHRGASLEIFIKPARPAKDLLVGELFGFRQAKGEVSEGGTLGSRYPRRRPLVTTGGEAISRFAPPVGWWGCRLLLVAVTNLAPAG